MDGETRPLPEMELLTIAVEVEVEVEVDVDVEVDDDDDLDLDFLVDVVPLSDFDALVDLVPLSDLADFVAFSVFAFDFLRFDFDVNFLLLLLLVNTRCSTVFVRAAPFEESQVDVLANDRVSLRDIPTRAN